MEEDARPARFGIILFTHHWFSIVPNTYPLVNERSYGKGTVAIYHHLLMMYIILEIVIVYGKLLNYQRTWTSKLKVVVSLSLGPTWSVQKVYSVHPYRNWSSLSQSLTKKAPGDP
jgi:hypothetical protein